MDYAALHRGYAILWDSLHQYLSSYEMVDKFFVAIPSVEARISNS